MQPDLEPIRAVLPQALRSAFDRLAPEQCGRLEELRLRAGRPFTALIDGAQIVFSDRGNALMIRPEDLTEIVSSACGQSIYSASEPIAQGYLTLRGGHRIGLFGTAVPGERGLITIRAFSSLNIRVARTCPGCASAAVETLRAAPGSVLIIGPPGSGKTTVLRDLICQLSDRLGYRVALADERGEVAAVFGGVPQLDVGRQTDVMSGGEKAQTMIRLLRAMNPQYLAVDEISDTRDLRALQHACYGGVRLIATAHAFSGEELFDRPLYRNLMQMRLFDYLLTMQSGRILKMEELRHSD